MSAPIHSVLQEPKSLLAPAKRTFWQEFWRVETDKVFLLALIVFLHFVHAADTLQAAAIGGLIMSIQGQRYSRNGERSR